MLIRTKIVATVGPASCQAKVLAQLVAAGVDVFRINLSHGTEAEHQAVLQAIRQVERDIDRPLAVMADLCGPKIRVGAIVGGSVLLGEGQQITIRRDPIEGDATQISTTLSELVDEVCNGEIILLDDGKLRLKVTDASPVDAFVCEVQRGGMLARGKGVNLPHTDLKLSALTQKDRTDVLWIAANEIDYVAISFVQKPADIEDLRAALAEQQRSIPIVAKIEKPQALACIDDILRATDAVMVARGDLGVEMDLPAVPVAQKRIARLAQQAGVPCIIATQMLESMTHSAVPTRAEVSDVANAVLDHADAVMLSGETAVGEFPVETVRMMDAVVSQIQEYHDETSPEADVVPGDAAPTVAALADAVRRILAREKIAAIAVFTLSGATARMFAKNRPGCPILGLSPNAEAVRQMCLYYGVLPMQVGKIEHTSEILEIAADFACQREVAKPGDKIVVISGRPLGESGRTNSLVVHEV